MSLTVLMQFWAPFVALLGVVFWLGVLTQTVKDLKDRLMKMEEGDAEGGMVDRMARLEVNSENANKTLEKITMELSSVQRQLGNLFVKQQP